MLLISCPRFIAIKEGVENDSSVYLDFGCLWDASLIPHIPVELAKGCTCFCESGVYLEIHDDRLREGAAEIGELFYHLQLSLDSVVGLDILFFRCWLLHYFYLFCADIWPKLSLVIAFSTQSLANRNSLTISVFTLVFAWSLLRLKTEPSVLYQMLIPLSEPLNASNSIAENMLKCMGARIHPLLNPICDWKGYRAFSAVLHPCMHAIMK